MRHKEKFQEAVSIVKKLIKNKAQAYLAGGCVRDMLMGKEPKDFDIVTSAKPEEIEKVFKKTRAVGKQFGVILVIGKTGTFEVATFRGEGEYQDYRRPSYVFWTGPKEDALRRDFTINGLFYDPIAKKVIDYVGGQKDIKEKKLRFIGIPQQRIKEDNLRLLRAVRFKNLLGFSFEERTERAILKYAKMIQNVSKERVKEEIDKMLIDSSRANSITDLSRLGLLGYILPEVERMKNVPQPPQFHAEGDVFEHTILSLQKLPKETKKEIVWATLLHDVGKPETFKIRKHPVFGERPTFYGHPKKGAEITESICRRLKFSKEERETVTFMVREHLRHKDFSKMKLAKQRRWAQHHLFTSLLILWKADAEASWLGKKDKIDLSLYQTANKLYQEELKRPKPPQPIINGYDVMRVLKIPPGPLVGKILKEIEEAQLEERIKNREEAIKYLSAYKGSLMKLKGGSTGSK